MFVLIRDCESVQVQGRTEGEGETASPGDCSLNAEPNLGLDLRCSDHDLS